MQGKMLEANVRFEEAFTLLETAHTLQPQNIYYTDALFERIWRNRLAIETKKINDTMGIGLRTKEPLVCPYSDIELAELISILVHQIRDNYTKDNLYKSNVFNKISSNLGTGIETFSGYFSNSVSVLNEQVRQINKESRKIWIDIKNDTFERHLANKEINQENLAMFKSKLVWISSDDPNELILNIKKAFNESVLPPEFGGRNFSIEARKRILDKGFLEELQMLSTLNIGITYLKDTRSTVIKLWYQYLKDLNKIDNTEINLISNLALMETQHLYNIAEEIEGNNLAYNTSKKLISELKGIDPEENGDETKERIISEINNIMLKNMTSAERGQIRKEMLSLLIEQRDIHNLALLRPCPRLGSRQSPTEADIRYDQIIDQIIKLFEAEKNDMQAIIALNCIKDEQFQTRGLSRESNVVIKETNKYVTILLTKENLPQKIKSSNPGISIYFQDEMLWVFFVSKGNRIYNEQDSWTTDIGLAGINLKQRKLTTIQQVKILTPKGIENSIGQITYNDKIVLSLFGTGIIVFPISNTNGQKQLITPKVYTRKNGLPSLSITSIAKADNNKLWIAYGGIEEESGLGLYDPQNEQWETVLCSTLKNDRAINTGQPFKITLLKYLDTNTLYIAVSDNSLNKLWESRLYKLDINTKETQYVRSFTSANSDEFADFMEMKRISIGNLRKEMFLVDSRFDDLIKRPLLIEGYLVLSTGDVYKNQFWARMGKSQILIAEKGKGFEEAEIIDNDLLNGKPVEKFISTPYGLIAIGEETVGLIETETVEK